MADGSPACLRDERKPPLKVDQIPKYPAGDCPFGSILENQLGRRKKNAHEQAEIRRWTVLKTSPTYSTFQPVRRLHRRWGSISLPTPNTPTTESCAQARESRVGWKVATGVMKARDKNRYPHAFSLASCTLRCNDTNTNSLYQRAISQYPPPLNSYPCVSPRPPGMKPRQSPTKVALSEGSSEHAGDAMAGANHRPSMKRISLDDTRLTRSFRYWRNSRPLRNNFGNQAS